MASIDSLVRTQQNVVHTVPPTRFESKTFKAITLGLAAAGAYVGTKLSYNHGMSGNVWCNESIHAAALGVGAPIITSAATALFLDSESDLYTADDDALNLEITLATHFATASSVAATFFLYNPSASFFGLAASAVAGIVGSHVLNSKIGTYAYTCAGASSVAYFASQFIR